MSSFYSSYTESVISYYDKAEISYRDIWDLDRSMALHYGYWDNEVKNFPQSLLRMNQVLASKLAPEPGTHILDAGCGVGGSSIFLALNYTCRTTGISLSDKQVKKSLLNAAKNNVADKCHFKVADFLSTGFDDNSFDCIWALESSCHAADKELFLKEAFRILKPGGKIILADGFKKAGLNADENNLVQKWLQGWSILDLETIENMSDYAARTGFTSLETIDLSRNIFPTSRRMYRFGLMAKYYGLFMRLFGKKYGNTYTLKNTVGAICQYQALKRGLWNYFLFYGEKPSIA